MLVDGWEIVCNVVGKLLLGMGTYNSESHLLDKYATSEYLYRKLSRMLFRYCKLRCPTSRF